jgi:DNA modification methylase
MGKLKYIKMFESFDNQYELGRKYRDILRNQMSGFEVEIDDLLSKGLSNDKDILFKLAYDKDRKDVVDYLKSQGLTISDIESVKSFVGHGKMGREDGVINQGIKKEIWGETSWDEMKSMPDDDRRAFLRAGDEKIRSMNKSKNTAKYGDKPTDPSGLKDYYKRKAEIDSEEKRNRLSRLTSHIK